MVGAIVLDCGNHWWLSPVTQNPEEMRKCSISVWARKGLEGVKDAEVLILPEWHTKGERTEEWKYMEHLGFSSACEV